MSGKIVDSAAIGLHRLGGTCRRNSSVRPLEIETDFSCDTYTQWSISLVVAQSRTCVDRWKGVSYFHGRRAESHRVEIRRRPLCQVLSLARFSRAPQFPGMQGSPAARTTAKSSDDDIGPQPVVAPQVIFSSTIVRRCREYNSRDCVFYNRGISMIPPDSFSSSSVETTRPQDGLFCVGLAKPYATQVLFDRYRRLPFAHRYPIKLSRRDSRRHAAQDRW